MKAPITGFHPHPSEPESPHLSEADLAPLPSQMVPEGSPSGLLMRMNKLCLRSAGSPGEGPCAQSRHSKRWPFIWCAACPQSTHGLCSLHLCHDVGNQVRRKEGEKVAMYPQCHSTVEKLKLRGTKSQGRLGHFSWWQDQVIVHCVCAWCVQVLTAPTVNIVASLTSRGL